MANGSLPSDELPWELLDRYFAGEATPAERSAIANWVGGSEARARDLELQRKIWAAVEMLPQERSVMHGWLRVAHAAGFEPVPLPEMRDALSAEPSSPEQMPGVVARRPREVMSHTPRRTATRAKVFWRAAAMLLVVLGGTYAWQHRAQTPRHAVTQSPTPAMREWSTGRGQYATVMLMDGSRIALAPMSRLRTAMSADTGQREVYLEGQGLFTVVHDTARPFRVHAAHAIATDLGTTFVVRAYIDAPRVEVIVAEGSVTLEPRAGLGGTVAPLVLRPGDLGRVTRNGVMSAAHRVALDQYTAWSEGRLVFRDTPLRDVIAELSRWYDLDIRSADASLLTRPVTVVVSNESPEQVLQLIALSLNIHAERNGRTVVLAP